jgi:DNA-binding PadR family transcriptional regulator
MRKNHWKLLRTLLESFTGGNSSATAWMKVAGIPEGSFYPAIKLLQEVGYVTKTGRTYVVTPAGESALKQL